MKKYMKPVMEGQVFVSNEYVGACWWVNCNIDKGDVYLENGKEAGLQTSGTNEDQLIGNNVSGCDTKHIGVTEEPVSNSYWYGREWVQTGENFWQGEYQYTTKACFSWQDENGWHSTYIGDQEYDTNPNAS